MTKTRENSPSCESRIEEPGYTRTLYFDIPYTGPYLSILGSINSYPFSVYPLTTEDIRRQERRERVERHLLWLIETGKIEFLPPSGGDIILGGAKTDAGGPGTC